LANATLLISLTVFLIGALSTFDQKGGNTEKELIVRDILDDFFGDLSTFQSHIEADLIKLQDIRPYLECWMRELTGRGRLRKHPFAEQTAKYLAFFGYNRVLALASNMGYRFPIPKQSHGATKSSPSWVRLLRRCVLGA
jgi:hypothetical protein